MTLMVHRFWMGRPMPMAYREYGRAWVDLNVDTTTALWDESAIDLLDRPLRLIVEDIWQRDAGRNGIEAAVQTADVMGYALVAMFGGVYTNCDMQPVRPLPDLPGSAWASYENDVDGRIVNAVIGAPDDGDAFWWGLLDALPDRYWSCREDEMVMSTGPGFLTEYASGRPGLFVFPRTTFNPVHWSEIAAGGDASGRLDGLPAETVAVHHWGHRRDGRTNRVEVATQ
jgi:mannosyltransferase OCH1-like enzyme